ncbi:MAG: hypothetical protein Fues2KO_26050 [Fuerstiella sp.]
MKRLAFFSLAVLLAGSSASAALVSGASSSDTSVATISLGASSETTSAGGSFFDDTATMTLDVTVFQKHVPVQFTLSFDPEPGSGSVTRTYDITFNVTNSLPSGGSLSYMNGFDITNGPFTNAASAQLNADIEPTGYFAFEDGPPPASEYNRPTGFRFGGLNGGGPASYNGDVTTNNFSFTITAAKSASPTATLNFTANPEPGTLALAGLALFPLGIAVRRRRKAAQQSEEV